MSNNKTKHRDTVTKYRSDDDKKGKAKAESREPTPELIKDDHSDGSHPLSDLSNVESDSEEFQELTPALLEAMREAEEYYADDESESIPRGQVIDHFDLDLTRWQDDVARRYEPVDNSDDDVLMVDDEDSRVNDKILTFYDEASKVKIMDPNEETYVSGQRRRIGEALVEVYDAVAEMTRGLGIVWDWQVENDRPSPLATSPMSSSDVELVDGLSSHFGQYEKQGLASNRGSRSTRQYGKTNALHTSSSIPKAEDGRHRRQRNELKSSPFPSDEEGGGDRKPT
ncbi:hypothetical protein FSHL1_006279 [Fusarium sambucinum]